MQHVAVGDDVVLPSSRNLPASRAGLALVGDVIVVAMVSARMNFFEIGMDDAGRLRARVPFSIVQARASFGPTVK